MIAVIRIAGRVEMVGDVADTLHRMRLRRKFTATLYPDNEQTKKLLHSVRNFVAYGPIKEPVLVKLVKSRGQPTDKKKTLNAEKSVEHIQTKGFEGSGIKPFFRLHPPRKGIVSKFHVGVGKGVLGDNGEAINALIERML